MPLSTEAQALFDHARNSIPRWVTAGKTAALEMIYAYGEIFEAVYDQAQEYLAGVYIGSATGRWVDQHARDRNTTRRVNETDAVLIERLRQIEDAVTDPALQAGINAIVNVTITIPFDTNLLISDTINVDSRFVLVPAGVYTAREILDLIGKGLYPGWSFTLVNGRFRFDAKDLAGASLEFNVEFQDSELGEAMGFTVGNAVDWYTPDDGYFQSDLLVPRACAIVHLRRARAHFHITGQSRAFYSRGYRATSAGRPMSYVVLLPGASAAEAEAVREYLRQYGPAGYIGYVEIYTP